jgi:hypothetical protein
MGPARQLRYGPLSVTARYGPRLQSVVECTVQATVSDCKIRARAVTVRAAAAVSRRVHGTGRVEWLIQVGGTGCRPSQSLRQDTGLGCSHGQSDSESVRATVSDCDKIRAVRAAAAVSRRVCVTGRSQSLQAPETEPRETKKSADSESTSLSCILLSDCILPCRVSRSPPVSSPPPKTKPPSLGFGWWFWVAVLDVRCNTL